MRKRNREFKVLMTENQKLSFVNADVLQQANILEAVNQVAEKFVKEPNLNNVLDYVTDAIKDTLKAEIAVIELFSTTSGVTSLFKGVLKLELDKAIHDRINKGHSILINNLDATHTEYVKYRMLCDQGIISFLSAPLFLHNKIIGFLGIFKKEQHDFTGRELRLLTIFCSQISIIIENASLLEKTRELTVTDELTQLNNFRYFKKKIEQEFIRAARYSHDLSLLMCDIDHFKGFNDTYGHQTGNIVLKTIADILKESSRPTDFVCRYGGEEFMLILTETNKEDAVKCAERIREKVQTVETFDEEGKKTRQVTLTIGVACFPEDQPKTTADFIEFADKALYSGKQSGRNRVSCYGKK
jgi:diguanylate cyclase (GGDEF)-like protein